MIISTVGICEKYEVIDVIFHTEVVVSKGMLGGGGLDLDEGFNKAKSAMVEKARKLGGNGVIGCDFETRMAVTPGMVNKQAFEIYCFGTVVKIED